MALSFTIDNVFSDTINITVYVSPAYTRYRVFARLTANKSDSTYDEMYDHITADFSVPIGGLRPSTSYTINVGYTNNYASTTVTWIGAQTRTTPADTGRVKSWNWSIANGTNATAAQTNAAYLAIQGKQSVANFSYLVWNDLCDKVYECVQASDKIWGTTGGVNGATTPSYAATRMTQTDRVLTAARFNAIRQNIGARISTSISPVTPGQDVSGTYFFTLIEALNRWITNINSN